MARLNRLLKTSKYKVVLRGHGFYRLREKGSLL
jgi:hypothetical protein